MPLAQRHDVDVVVDQHRHVEGALHVGRHVVAVPAGHDRRVDRPAGRVLDGAGQADADRGQLGHGAVLLARASPRSAARPSRARARARSPRRGPRGARRGSCRRGRRARSGRAWRRCRRPPPPGRRGSTPAATAAGRRWTPRRRTAPPGRAASARRSGRRSSSGPVPRRRRAGRGSGAARPAAARRRRWSARPEVCHRQFCTSSKQLLPDSRQKWVTRATVTGVPRVHRARSLAQRARPVQELRRPPRARRRRPRAAQRPGARPGRRERRRQVDADEDPRRRAPARRGHHRARRRAGLVQPPGPGPAGRPLHGLPGVQPAAGALGRRERLPRPRAAPPRPRRHRPDAARHRRAARATSASPASGPASGSARCRVAEQQIVEIAKAVSFDARIISMDEPTAALADHEVELLYAIIAGLTARGVGDPLRLPPAQGDLRPLRHHHRAQGRPAGHHPAGRRARRRRAGPADGRPLDLVVLPRPGARAPRSASRCSSSAAPATATSTASTSPCAPARSSASPACRAPAAPSCSRRSSASARSPAARCCSTASRCARRSPRARRSAPGWR